MIRKLKQWLCKHDWKEGGQLARGRYMVCVHCDKIHVVDDHWR